MKLSCLASIYLGLILTTSIVFHAHFYGVDNFKKYLTQHNNYDSFITLPALPSGAATSNNGEYIFTAVPLRPQIMKINLRSKVVAESKPYADYYFGGMSVGYEGKYLYVSRPFSDEVAVLSVKNLETICAVKVGDYPKDIFTCDDKYIIVLNYCGKSISVIDSRKNTIAATMNVGKYPTDVAFNRDFSRMFVVCGGNSTVYIVNVGTFQVVKKLQLKEKPYGVACGPDERQIAVTLFKRNKVIIIELESGKVIGEINVGEYPTKIKYSKSGKMLYNINAVDNTVSFIDAEHNALLKNVYTGRCPIEISVFQNSEKLLVVNGYDWVKSISMIE